MWLEDAVEVRFEELLLLLLLLALLKLFWLCAWWLSSDIIEYWDSFEGDFPKLSPKKDLLDEDGACPI